MRYNVNLFNVIKKKAIKNLPPPQAVGKKNNKLITIYNE